MHPQIMYAAVIVILSLRVAQLQNGESGRESIHDSAEHSKMRGLKRPM